MSDIRFCIQDSWFEYDEDKNRVNINKHGLSFRTAARVFFDYDRIEFYDDTHSNDEDRYDTIGNLSVHAVMIGRPQNTHEDIVFVVYTERQMTLPDSEAPHTVRRIISARMANSFERGVYYGHQDEF